MGNDRNADRSGKHVEESGGCVNDRTEHGGCVADDIVWIIDRELAM